MKKMNKKIGFIGCGNMGGAIIGAVVKKNIAKSGMIFVYDKNEAQADKIKKEFKVNKANSYDDFAETDILFLCVKPNVLYDVIDEIKNIIKDDCIVVSIAAGQSISKIEKRFEKPLKVVRVMPNTPALVLEGMSAVSVNENAKDSTKEVMEILEGIGKAEIVSEKLMDAVTGISGSSPAYVFMFIEAMADAGVLHGMSRDMAYTFASQAVLGSAKMVLETGKNPAELKDMVCSPSGTTIEAVKVLEDKGFRGAVIEAIDACVKKSQNM